MAMTYELEVIQALQQKKATPQMIKDLVNDVKEHLKHPIATLNNYSGKFGPVALRLLQDQYAYFPPNDEIIKNKMFKIASLITDCLSTNKKIKNHPSMFKIALEYLSSLKETNQQESSHPNNVVVLGFSPSDEGSQIFALPKK